MDKNEERRCFEKIESLFKRLLSSVEEIFSESEIEYISKFIYVGEYSIALDAVTGTFVEENKKPTPEVICLVAELLVLMECDEETYSKFSQFLQCYKKIE